MREDWGLHMARALLTLPVTVRFADTTGKGRGEKELMADAVACDRAFFPKNAEEMDRWDPAAHTLQVRACVQSRGWRTKAN